MNERDLSAEWCERVVAAAADGTALQLVGGNSKAFYGRRPVGAVFDLSGHSGIVNYQPTELVITARSGTPLTEIHAALAAEGQMLPFEPPLFGGEATLGGALASGLSGPARPWRGAARDLVLGCRLINGRGEHLRFGGEVMKNVAGYDVSRLMAGAMGTLGIITEASFKVLPQPPMEQTLCLESSQTAALQSLNLWRSRPLPLSAAAWLQERLWLRLSGTEAAVRQAMQQLGGEAADAGIWSALRDQQLEFFTLGDTPLWRLSLPPATPVLDGFDEVLVDWGGAQRWLRSGDPAEQVRAVAAAAGGHAELFRDGDRDGERLPPPDPLRLQLHRRIKAAFDPHGLFNPGRLYRDC